MGCQVDGMDYKKPEPSQRTSTPRGINIRRPNPWPPPRSLLSFLFSRPPSPCTCSQETSAGERKKKQPTARHKWNQGQLSDPFQLHDRSSGHYKAAWAPHRIQYSSCVARRVKSPETNLNMTRQEHSQSQRQVKISCVHDRACLAGSMAKIRQEKEALSCIAPLLQLIYI